MNHVNKSNNATSSELIQEAIGLLSGVQLGLLRGEELSDVKNKLYLRWVLKAVTQINDAAQSA